MHYEAVTKDMSCPELSFARVVSTNFSNNLGNENGFAGLLEVMGYA